MSQPEQTPIPQPPKVNLPKEWDGSLIVPDEELQEAVKNDPWMNKLADIIAKDQAYLVEMRQQIAVKQLELKKMKAYKLRVEVRLYARAREWKHFTKLVKKRLAWKKIKDKREDIGL